MLIPENFMSSITQKLIHSIRDKRADKIVIDGKEYNTCDINDAYKHVPDEYIKEYDLGMKIIEALKTHDNGSYKVTIQRREKFHSTIKDDTQTSFCIEYHVMGALGAYVKLCILTQYDVLGKKLVVDNIYHNSKSCSTLEKIIAPINDALVNNAKNKAN